MLLETWPSMIHGRTLIPGTEAFFELSHVLDEVKPDVYALFDSVGRAAGKSNLLKVLNGREDVEERSSDDKDPSTKSLLFLLQFFFGDTAIHCEEICQKGDEWRSDTVGVRVSVGF